MNARYRCLGCRQYRPAPAPRKIGLGGVCSDDCQALVAGKARTKAAERPRDEIPAATRKAVLVRDRARCRFCGKTAVHVHHINYRSEGVDHSASNLICLCPAHHDLVHSDKRRWKPLLLATMEHVLAGREVTVLQVERWQRLSSHLTTR